MATATASVDVKRAPPESDADFDKVGAVAAAEAAAAAEGVATLGEGEAAEGFAAAGVKALSAARSTCEADLGDPGPEGDARFGECTSTERVRAARVRVAGVADALVGDRMGE